VARSDEVTERAIVAGLRELGLSASSTVVVHASLRSFGRVAGGAEAVCRALLEVCGTVMLPAGTWEAAGVPAPPGLTRPHNAYVSTATWAQFDDELARATPFTPGLAVDRSLGRIAETMRRRFPHERGTHPLLSYLAVGPNARRLVQAQRPEWPLGPFEALADLDGDVLLLGVTHTSNTAIHLAEQQLGRSRFYRYAKTAPGIWTELPNIPGESHRFDELAPDVEPSSRSTRIGGCRALRVPIRAVLDAARRRIQADPAALLCGDPDCRCGAALQQRLAVLTCVEGGDPRDGATASRPGRAR
jgi:aminoglycoside 3-N-acetyltransferase